MEDDAYKEVFRQDKGRRKQVWICNTKKGMEEFEQDMSNTVRNDAVSTAELNLNEIKDIAGGHLLDHLTNAISNMTCAISGHKNVRLKTKLFGQNGRNAVYAERCERCGKTFYYVREGKGVKGLLEAQYNTLLAKVANE